MPLDHHVDTVDLVFDVVDPPLRRSVFGDPDWSACSCGTRRGEGPTYFADLDIVVWSDIPNSRMPRSVESQGTTVFRIPNQPHPRAGGDHEPRGDRLYITGLTSLWSVYGHRKGAQRS